MKKGLWMKVLAIDMLVLGVSFSISLVGQMFDAIKNVYQLSLSQAGWLLSVQSIGGFAVAIMCLLFVDSLNKTKLIVISGVLLCVFLIMVGIKLPLFLVFIVFIMLGLFTGVVNTLTNAVMAETVPANADKHINFMHMIFSLGAVLVPILCSVIYHYLDLSGVFFVLGGFSLFWPIYAVIIFNANVKQKLLKNTVGIKFRLQKMQKVIRIPVMKEIGLIAVLATCWQLSAIYYVSSLFSGLTGNVSDGAYALSILFLGMMVSRLLYTKVVNRFSKGCVIAIGCLLGAVVWTIAMFVNDIFIKIILIGLSAFFCGNNFPITFSAACRLSPKNTATALGIAFLGYYLALFIFVPIIGAVGETMGLNNALLFNGIPLIALIPVALRLHTKMKMSIVE